MYIVMDSTKVRTMRQEQRLSQAGLADAAGLGSSTVANLERGRAAVRLSTARKVGAALGVDPKSLGQPKR